MKCPYCANTISDDAQVCPFCNEKLTTTCPYCKETISIYDKECPHCNSNLTHQDKIFVLDIITYLFITLNIIFTTFYVKNIGLILYTMAERSDRHDFITMTISISTLCIIPPMVAILRHYKVRKFGICIFLNILFTIICLLSAFLTTI